jgi:hypothetical protein
MVTEHDDTSDELPAEVDPLAGAILPMIEAIFAASHEGSPERERAMAELFSSIARIRAALAPAPRLN